MEAAIDTTGLQLLAISNILSHLLAEFDGLGGQLLHLIFEVLLPLSIINIVALKDVQQLSIPLVLGLEEHSAKPPT